MSQSMDLKTLLKNVPVVKQVGANDNPYISNLAIHSQNVQPNGIFFAIQGSKADGLDYVEEAIARGASVIIAERLLPHLNVHQVQVRDVRETMAIIAQRFYGMADAKLRMVGITGTSGKTTTSWLLRHIYKQGFHKPTGLLGTLHYDLGKRILPSLRTTPDAVSISAYLHEMLQSEYTHAILEVSSHALTQKRVSHLHWDTAAFTNLSLEHLDYHKDIESYFQAKRILFQSKNLKHIVVNIDDVYGQRLADEFAGKKDLVSVGIYKQAKLRAINLRMDHQGSSFDLVTPEGIFAVKTHLLGEFNIYNCLIVLGICYAQGYDLKDAIEAIKSFTGTPGRLENMTCTQPYGFTVYVDYAHKPEALKRVLQTVRPLTSGNLYLVFGCGGDRDRSKRSVMARIAESYADKSWATSDNPRTEDQEQIFSDMKQGLQSNDRVTFIKDRAEAIHQAFLQCKAGDCLIVAGKGHERYQEINNQLLPFDDRLVVETCFLSQKKA